MGSYVTYLVYQLGKLFEFIWINQGPIWQLVIALTDCIFSFVVSKNALICPYWNNFNID